jgi:DNA-damage-inducible protein J
VLKNVGITPSDAITMFLHQVVLQKGLPFETRIPNAESRAAIREWRDPAKRAKMKVYTGSTKEIFDKILKSGK